MYKLLILSLFVSVVAYSATTNTSSAGNWSTGGNWDNGVPASNDVANVNHAMNINTNITVNGGNYSINSPITDASGGSAYNLSVGKNGGTPGYFDVDANATFEGTLSVTDDGNLTIRSGDTLVVGATTFALGSFVTIEAGGVMIINGDLTNNNNSTGITINGEIIVNGDVSGGNGSSMGGSGGMTATGSITTSGSATIFGSTASCPTGPCVTTSGAPLPIELLSFKCEKTPAGVRINWITVAEFNNDYFAIERSNDLKEIEDIIRIPGAGESRQELEYSHIDDAASNGTWYYRLRQVDFNGNYTHYKWTSADVEFEENNILVYPQPASTEITFRLREAGEEDYTLVIHDVSGREIYNETAEFDQLGKIQIDASSFPKGILFYNLQTGNEIYTGRVLK